MNKEMNTNQAKLPIKARIGRGKVANRLQTAHFKNARNKVTGGKAFKMKKSQLKITRTIEGRKGGISVTSRNLIAKDGKIVRIKRNITLNSGKKLVKPVGKKISQTQNIRNNSRNRLGENSNTVGRKILRTQDIRNNSRNRLGQKSNTVGRKILQTQDIRNNSRNRLEQDLNPSVRKVEFDDQGGLEVEAGQGNFMGNVNYGFEAMPIFPQIPLLPTPPVQQRIFPPVLEPFHNNSQNLMNVNFDNLRNLELQNAQKYDEELRALERKRVEEEIREIERKRMEEMEMKRKQEEEMRKMERKREEEMREMERKRLEELMFEEEQKRFEEEQRRYKEEQRMIEEERKNLDYLRKALEMEKRELENLKKTVEEEEEEMERRSVSKGREMTNKFVGGLDSNRSKQIGKLNKPISQRDRYDSRVNNSNRKYGKEDFNSSSQKMPNADFMDFMLNKPSGSRGDSERREMGGNFRGKGGGRGKNSNNTRDGRGGGGNINTSDRGKGRNNNSRGYDQSSKFNDSERRYDTRNSGMLNYMFDSEPSDAPGYSQAGNFNQSDNYYSSNFDDRSRRGEFDMARRGEYDDMSRRGEYDNMSRRGEYDDTSRREEYDDMTRRGEEDMTGSGGYDDMTRRGEYDDMRRKGEYDDIPRRREYYDTSRRGEYDDTSRQGEYNYSDGNNNAEYSFQRGSSREGEVFSNKNSNFDNHTESGYQILSRGFKPFKDDEQKTPYQSTNNFGSYQESFAGHPYYDDMYDQGRINRNQTGNSGRLGSQEKQETWSGPSFSSRTEENKFGFVGYPFKNKSPIYEGPRRSERNNSSNQNLGEHTSNSSNQQEKSMDSFYSYRPSDKPTNDKSGSSGIDILGGGTNLMTSPSGKSSANFGKNSVNSRYDSNFYGKVVQNPNMGSTSYSNSSSNPVDNDFGNESQGNIKSLQKRKTRIMSSLRKLDPSNEERKETLLKNLNDVRNSIARLKNPYGQNMKNRYG